MHIFALIQGSDWAVWKHQMGAEAAAQVLTAPLLPPSLPWPQPACAPPSPVCHGCWQTRLHRWLLHLTTRDHTGISNTELTADVSKL